jgi:ABC-type branched-subunit amino acid transport system permease subunit
LITVYTMVILGGSGSQAGVVVGAILISVLLELLRDPGDAQVLFYAVGALALLATFRLSRKLAVVVAATAAFGFAARAIADAINTTWVSGVTPDGRDVPAWASDWVIVPSHLSSWITPVSYVSLIVITLGLTLVSGWLRLALLVPTLYLAAFVWENVMLAKPEPTRYIVLGALLIALMILRPNGLLGEKRVEIV